MRKPCRGSAVFLLGMVAVLSAALSDASRATEPLVSIGYERYEVEATTIGQEFSAEGSTGRGVRFERAGVGFLLRSALLLPVLGSDRSMGLDWAIGPVLHVFIDDTQDSDAPTLRGRIDFITRWERSLWQIGESRFGPSDISLDGHIGMGFAFFRDKDFRLGPDFRAYGDAHDPGAHIQT